MKPKQETMKKNQVEILNMKNRQYLDNRVPERGREMKHFQGRINISRNNNFSELKIKQVKSVKPQTAK